MQPTPNDMVRHPPERGPSRLEAIAPAGCCCCCCCCCLHTIGGIVGGIVGSTSSMDLDRPSYVRFREDDRDGPYLGRNDPDDDRFRIDRDNRLRYRDDEPFPFRRDVFDEDTGLLPVPLLYWLLVVALVAVTAVITFLTNGATNPSLLVLGGVVGVMILPALQLVASVLTAVLVLIFYPERSRPLRRVGRITLWSFVGTMVGTLAMAGCFGLFFLR